MYPNGANAYRKAQVTTSNPVQLVVQLYQGAATFLERAIQAMERNDVEQAHVALIRTQDIITQLRATLNHDAGPLAQNLESLYDYFWRQLILANVKKDPTIAREVLGHLRKLQEAWSTIAGPGWAEVSSSSTTTGFAQRAAGGTFG